MSIMLKAFFALVDRCADYPFALEFPITWNTKGKGKKDKPSTKDRMNSKQQEKKKGYLIAPIHILSSTIPSAVKEAMGGKGLGMEI